MKNLKRLMALALAMCLLLCLCACGGGNEDPTDPVETPAPTENNEATVETTEATEEVKEPTYTVTVVDEANNPVVGAWVQLCLEACVPAATNENGVAEFFLEENEYKVSFTMMPEGYDYATEEQEWYFADGENTMTIVLKAVA